MAHPVEIDLLRIADPMPLQNCQPWDYCILVSRSEARPNADLYGFTLPLKHPEEFVSIDLQSILQGGDDRAGYDYRIDYQQAVPPPKLSAEDPHPGEMLLEEFLQPMGLSQRELAAAMHVPYQRINEIVNGRRGMTPSTATSIGLMLT
jgi:addiction module HigA family antidote